MTDINTTNTTPTPATTPRTRRTARATTPATFTRPASIADVWRMAKRVTPDTFDAAIMAANTDHGVPHAARNVGRFTGTRIVHFQNTTLIDNADRKLADVGLLFAWRVEFPAASGRVFAGSMADGLRIVHGVRAEFNRDGHGEPHRKPAGFTSTRVGK